MVKPRHNFVRGTFLFVLDGHCMRHKNLDKNDSNKCKSSMISRKFGRCHTRQAGRRAPEATQKATSCCYMHHQIVLDTTNSFWPSSYSSHFPGGNSEGNEARRTRRGSSGKNNNGLLSSLLIMHAIPFPGKAGRARASAWLVLCSDWGLLTFATHKQTARGEDREDRRRERVREEEKAY